MSKRVLVNIRGCNGSGKSTIPMSMMNDPKICVETLVDSFGQKIAALTVFPSYGWVALGTYFNKTGGLDGISCIEATKIALQAAICLYPDYDVLMEGILCSTTFSSYSAMYHEVEEVYGIQVIILSLLPPVEEAIRRVYKRNGGKPVKEELIQGKWNSVLNSHKKFKEERFTICRVDTSRIKKERMLKAFLKTVEKYRGDV